jgi:hemoglobin
MKNSTNNHWTWLVCIVAASFAGTAFAGEAPSVEEQITSLKTMCSESVEARAQRQADNPLYFRLGGYEKIHAFTREIVRLHNQNESIKSMFAHVDSGALAKHVADFVAAGTGGPSNYSGRDMPSAHRHLNITDADFLSAGGDIVTAMHTMEYGQEEIDEMLCILVSLKDQVVLN